MGEHSWEIKKDSRSYFNDKVTYSGFKVTIAQGKEYVTHSSVPPWLNTLFCLGLLKLVHDNLKLLLNHFHLTDVLVLGRRLTKPSDDWHWQREHILWGVRSSHTGKDAGFYSCAKLFDGFVPGSCLEQWIEKHSLSSIEKWSQTISDVCHKSQRGKW